MNPYGDKCASSRSVSSSGTKSGVEVDAYIMIGQRDLEWGVLCFVPPTLNLRASTRGKQPKRAMASCEAKRIQQNSAKQVLEQAQQAFASTRADYLACQGPQAQGADALATAKEPMDHAVASASELLLMNEFILGQLQREAANRSVLDDVSEIASTEVDKLQREVSDLKTQIRTHRRRFLDSGPQSKVTGPTGLYFTQESNNQVLIAFMACYGAFLLVIGLFIWMNHIPMDYFRKLTSPERTRITLTGWGICVGVAALGLVLFT